jgi:hypothetical protein
VACKNLQETWWRLSQNLIMKKLSDKQKKSLDKTGDGKLTKEDFLLVRKLKNKKKNGKA